MAASGAMDDTRAVLHQLPVLGLLPADVRKLVVDSFVPVAFPFGSVVVHEGDPADALYVLAAGRARVVKQGDRGEELALNVLRAGDSFGETALLEHVTRNATVRASTDLEAYRLDRSVFDALVANHPEIRHFFELQGRRRTLHSFLREYSPFGRLPVEALQLMLESLEVVPAAPGELVIREGDPPGPMYVVEAGQLRVFTTDGGHRRYLAYLRKGDFFGEMSLFTGAHRAASVEAVSPGVLRRLTPETFRTLLDRYPDFKTQIEARVAQYDYRRVARVPLDFAEELLPAEVRVHHKVGPEQVSQSADEAEAKAEAEAGTDARVDAVAGPFASPEGLFVKRPRRIRRLPFVPQVDEMDCGAAALAMVCRHFGRAVSLARIRQVAHTSTDGTNLRGLCRAAEELGLAARSLKVSSRHLDEVPLPAIVHWEGNHWVVLYDVGRAEVRLADPAMGPRRLSRAEFEARWTGYVALFDYTETFAQAPEGRPAVAWVWPFVRPHLRALILAAGLAVLVAGLQLALPVATQLVVDRVVVGRAVGLLPTLILALLAALAFMALSLVVQRYLLSRVAVRLDAATLDFLSQRLLLLPMRYFATRRTGDIQRRLAGMRQVRELVVQHGVAGLTATVQLGAALALMAVYSPRLAAVFLVTAPLYALLMRASARWLRPIFDSLEEAFSRYFAHQLDAIKGIETVKALGAEGALRQRMVDEFHRVAHRQFRADFTAMCYDAAIQSLTFLSLVLFLWIGAREVLAGALTIGGLVAFNGLVGLANGPIGTLLALWDDAQLASVLLRRLSDVFEEEPEQGGDHPPLVPVRSLEGRVRLQNVGFRYGGPESPTILEGLTVEVPPGTMVAIVGRSGAGKTTLIKCLAGLLEPTEGTIFYDGVDLRTLDHRALRRQIGFVLQDNHLFDDTIARNIAFGDEEPDLDRVLWAARAANAHEFVDRLPLQYDTRVGESGLALSAGQRQRLAIARALYHRPTLFVLDEATSALDAESERLITENLDRLLAGRTAFVVAHRLSTIKDAGLILVLDHGRLVEQGSHDALMERQGLYYYLVSQQLGLASTGGPAPL